MSGESIQKISNSIEGKKVFFLYPTVSVTNQIISELVQHEYETYIAKNHSRLVRALKKYNDAVVFVNLDEGMSEMEWERWLGAVVKTAPDVKLGAFSSKTNDEYKDKYVKNFNISCGFLNSRLDMSKTANFILDELKILEIKGRRKYLRACTKREANTSINIPYNGEFINGVIKDISIVGVSCVFEKDPGLKKNALYKDIQIRLQSYLLRTEAIVFGSREADGEKIYVLLFTQHLDSETKVKIRKYIQSSLQSKMDAEIN